MLTVLKKSSVAEEGVLKLAIYYKSYQLAANTKSAYQIVFWSSSHSHGDLFTLFLDKKTETTEIYFSRPPGVTACIFYSLFVDRLFTVTVGEFLPEMRVTRR